MINLLREIWEQISKVLKFIGKVQSMLLLSIFYYLILGPIAIIKHLVSLVSNEEKEMKTYWIKRDAEPETEKTLLRQF